MISVLMGKKKKSKKKSPLKEKMTLAQKMKFDVAAIMKRKIVTEDQIGEAR